MSPSRRPSSAPSGSWSPLTESNNAAQSTQDVIGQWAPKRGTRTELETNLPGPTTVQLGTESRRVNEDRILPVPEKAPNANEAAESPAVNHVVHESTKVDPWKRKTLLTLGTDTMDPVCERKYL